MQLEQTLFTTPFEPISLLTGQWIDSTVRFIADPFLRRDDKGWALFFEVLWHDGAKQIAAARSLDLITWELVEHPIADIPASYPYVLWHEGDWWLFPHQDDTADLVVYRTTKERFPSGWAKWSQLPLAPQDNDRLVWLMGEQLILLYGSRIRPFPGTCLKWGRLSPDFKRLEHKGIVARRSPLDWLANRLWRKTITTYRPAGDVLTWQGNAYLPLQAYGADRLYGSQFGLFQLTGGADRLGLKTAVYVTADTFLPTWQLTHHFSSQKYNDDLIVAVDGRSKDGEWSIGIFRLRENG